MLRRACRTALACALLCSGAHAQEPPVSAEPPPSEEELFFSLDSPVGPVEYVAGRGLHLGRTGLTVGGYSTLEIDREEGEPGRFQLDTVDFLVLFQPFDFFRGFADIEIGELFQIETNDDDVRSNPDVTVARLFGDLSHGDALNARFGKFQTPVGRWNLAPAEPFVWTATEPAIVETAFDEHQTGAALFGSLYPSSQELTWWLYGQVLDPLDPPTDRDEAHRSVGGRLEYGGALGAWSVGASFLASERKDDWNYLGGLDGFWQLGPLEVQSELVIVRGQIPGRNLWGIYLQSVYDLEALHAPLADLYFVLRYEHFDPSGWSRQANVGDIAFTWVPGRFVNVKAGYRVSDHQTADVRRGFFSSLSVLF